MLMPMRWNGLTAGLAACAATVGLMVPSAMASYSVNLNSPSELGAAASLAATNLLSFYTPNAAGDYDQTIVHWHESGIAWGSVLENHMRTGDGQLDGIVTAAMVNASFGPVGDYLDGVQGRLTQEAWLGKWNDDIGHWGMSAATAADLFGTTQPMPGAGNNHTFTSLLLTTYNEMWEQWDTACGGGIYWSRDRTDSSSTDSTYKSSISNALHIAMGARLATLDPANKDTYIAKAHQVYTWFSSSYLMSSSHRVYDGVHTTACMNITGTEYSYNQGMLINGLAYLYNATNDAYWLNEANALLDTSIALFVEQSTNILRDSCEATNACNQGQLNGGSGFKGILARGMAYLYPFTDSNRQSTIKTVLLASMNAALSKSCDGNLFCNEVWTGSLAYPVKSPRTQITFLQLMNAVTGVLSASHVTASTVGSGVTGTGDDGLNGGVYFGSASRSQGTVSFLLAAMLTVVASTHLFSYLF